MSILTIARSPAPTVTPEATVLDAVKVMEREKVGAVAVVRDGVLAGILTERDVLLRVVAAGRDAKTERVAEVMTRQVSTIHPDTKETTAINIMTEKHFRHLPVVDAQGALVGMLSMRHLLRERVEILSKQLDGVTNYVGADGIGG
jgi:CBS domain-containing protein